MWKTRGIRGNMNYKIDWDKLTEAEASDILSLICGKFNVLARTPGINAMLDVSYLDIKGIYDDNLHAEYLKAKK